MAEFMAFILALVYICSVLFLRPQRQNMFGSNAALLLCKLLSPHTRKDALVEATYLSRWLPHHCKTQIRCSTTFTCCGCLYCIHESLPLTLLLLYWAGLSEKHRHLIILWEGKCKLKKYLY